MDKTKKELETKVISSLAKVFPDEVKGETLKKATLLQNEPFSFQIAFKSTSGRAVEPLYVRVESDIDLKYVSEYLVGYVPITRGVHINTDEFYDRKTAGLYPDMLLERKTNAEVSDDGSWGHRWFEQDQNHLVNASNDSYQSLWFTVNENGEKLDCGKHTIKVSFYSALENKLVSSDTLELEIIPASLPKQELIYTCWMHYDCLADLYGTEVFSDRHFEIIRSFLLAAVKNGMNMIFLPAFTPPLDISVGKERKTVQLVKVALNDGEYSFDFSLMERFIDMCRECGFTHFEHSHLFTQWGAKHAPKIMATVQGEYKKLFGWETDATGKEYAEFLNCYLAQLKKFLDKVGVGKNILFHISDEPQDEHFSYYENAKKLVEHNIEGYTIADALSHFKFYQNGSTKLPIVDIASGELDKFVENCEDFWVYYTGGPQISEGYSNRMINATSARNRVLGIQLYVSGAKGFLHWGYNYYYDVLSHGIFNPTYNPCGYSQLMGAGAGTCFVVYPDTSGKAIESMRLKVFYEGLNDHRALKKLESLIGSTATLEFIKQHLGDVNFKFCPSATQLFEFRQKLNKEISKKI